MCSNQLITAVSGALLAIVGILLVLWGSGLFTQRLHMDWKLALGLVLAGIGIFMLSFSRPEFGNALNVLAVLILAFAAFWTVKKTNEYSSQVRIEEKEIEFKRRAIYEVMDWVGEVNKALAMPAENYSQAEIIFVHMRWTALCEEGLNIELTASVFGNELKIVISEIRKALSSVCEVLPVGWPNQPELTDENKQQFVERVKQLRIYLVNAINHIVRIRVHDQL